MTSQDTIPSVEIKVGLTVIALLVVALSWAVARRFLHSEDAPPAAVSTPGYHLTSPNRRRRPIEPRPMVLPTRGRDSGPASYHGPQPLEPRNTAIQYDIRPLDHPPSLLPALPPGGNRRDTRGVEEIRGKGREGGGSNDECRMSNVEYRMSNVEGRRSKVEGRRSNDEGFARHAVRARVGERGNVIDRPISTASALAPPWATTNPFVAASPTGAMQEQSPPPRLVVQDPEILPIGYRELQPGRPYITIQHDSWRSIAQSELGDAQRWPEIYYLNRAQSGQLTDTLPAGTRIVLPARAKQ